MNLPVLQKIEGMNDATGFHPGMPSEGNKLSKQELIGQLTKLSHMIKYYEGNIEQLKELVLNTSSWDAEEYAERHMPKPIFEKTGKTAEGERRRYLQVTYTMDWNEPSILEKCKELTAGIPDNDCSRKAVELFYFVRDEIKFAYQLDGIYIKNLRASHTLKQKKNWCVPKTLLFISLARAANIPSRIHHVDIKNHKSILPRFNTNLFVYHGFAELYLNGKWVQATPAFDKNLCQELAVPVVEFDGINHAKLSPVDLNGKKYVEYLCDRGVFSDLPYEALISEMIKTYMPQATDSMDQFINNAMAGTGLDVLEKMD